MTVNYTVFFKNVMCTKCTAMDPLTGQTDKHLYEPKSNGRGGGGKLTTMQSYD